MVRSTVVVLVAGASVEERVSVVVTVVTGAASRLTVMQPLSGTTAAITNR
ncbi:MAG TPA: hypothetical protein VIS99_11160 [Terrimicrobiaceae bacterium]